MTEALLSYGSTLKRAGVNVAELRLIGGVEVSRDMTDVTSNGSPDRYREYIPGLKDGGQIPLDGNFIPGDTNGQIALLTDFEDGVLQSFELTGPGFLWTFKGYVEKFKVGDFPVEGKVPFSASLKVSGKPVLTISSSDLQSAIDAAGDNGQINWAPRIYTVSTPLEPRSGQQWLLQPGGYFRPAGNNKILNIVGKNNLELQGTMYIDDAGLHTSCEAVYIDDLTFSHFDNIVIVNYFNGIEFRGTVGTNENDFDHINMRYIRNRGMNLETQVHDNHFGKVWIKGPSPTSWAADAGIRIATNGVQGGNRFEFAGILDMNKGLDLPGAFETWFGCALVDNPMAAGIYISGGCERLFFDTIWASSGGDGVFFQGDPTSLPDTLADKVHIGKLYSWLNANYGVRFEGYCKWITIDQLITQRNARGLGFSGPQNDDIRIGKLISMENTEFGVDGGGCGENCVIEQATIYDSVFNLENFAELNGDRPGVGKFETRGKATILSGNSSTDVTHRLENTPYQALLSAEHSETVGAYVSAKTSTTFTITVPGAVSGNRKVSYQSWSRAKHGLELLQNPNVEASTGGSPDHWSPSGAGAMYSTVFRTEGHSLQLSVVSDTASWQADYFPVTENANYHLSGFFKGTGSSQCFLTIRWWSNPDGTGFISEDNLALNATYADWTQQMSELVAPAGAQSADVLFRCPSATTADINGDDFSVREII